MTGVHNPSEERLLAYAAGTLSPPEAVVVAAHLAMRPQNDAWVRTLQALGGRLLDDLEPQALAEDAARFNTRFYELRSHYRDEEFELWASWQAPYPELVALLDRWESRFVGTALATTKDQASAHALLRSAGRDWPIFGKEFSLDKEQQIRGIAEKYKVRPEEILFVDDLLENLEQVKPTGARLAMASWGYNTADSRIEASEKGYPVVDIAGLEVFLGGLLAEDNV